MSRAHSGNGDCHEWGEAVEMWVCGKYGFDYVDETHHDAATESGKPIQIKGCRKWVSNGSDKRCRGRAKFWEKDHEYLKEESGLYLLVVYEQDHDEMYDIDVQKAQLFTAARIEQLIDNGWYTENDPRERKKGRIYRTTWADYFDPEDLK